MAQTWREARCGGERSIRNKMRTQPGEDRETELLLHTTETPPQREEAPPQRGGTPPQHRETPPGLQRSLRHPQNMVNLGPARGLVKMLVTLLSVGIQWTCSCSVVM